jgi:hypothetical protein
VLFRLFSSAEGDVMRLNALPKTAFVISALIFSTVIGNAQSVPVDKGPSAGGVSPATPPTATSRPAPAASSTSPVGVGGSPTSNTVPGSTAGAPPPAPEADKSGNVPGTANAGTPGSATPTTSSHPSPKSGSTAPPSGSAPASAGVNVTPEQKTVIRQTVINNKSAPRIANVNFNIGVGVAVPASVEFAPLPPTILGLNPGWEAYYYFVYQEEIVIVDPATRQIIAVVRV